MLGHTTNKIISPGMGFHLKAVNIKKSFVSGDFLLQLILDFSPNHNFSQKTRCHFLALMLLHSTQNLINTSKYIVYKVKYKKYINKLAANKMIE